MATNIKGNIKKISVIMATYNGGRYIEEALDSVLRQTYPDFEIIVVDDGSTDDTRWIIGGMQRKDYRVQYFHIENQGPGLAKNFGVEKSSGEYIAFLDDDDIWNDNKKLQKQAHFFEKYPNLCLIGSEEIELIDENGRNIKSYFLPRDDKAIRNNMLLKNCFVGSSVMFPKKAFLKAGKFKNMRYDEDYDLWLRMGKIGKMANIKTSVSYRVHKNSVSSKNKLLMYKPWIPLIKKYRNDYPNFYLGYLKAQLRILHFYILGK